MRTSGGYTIIEVLIFLTISTAVFVAAQLVFQGQQGKTQFEQGMNELASRLQLYVGQVGTGIFPGQDQYSCSISVASGRSALSAGGNAGTSQECIFLGSAFQVVPGNSDLYIYTVLGNRTVTISGQVQPVTSLAQALPEPVVKNGANLTQTYSTTWAKVVSSKITLAAGTTTSSDLVGFYNDLSSSYASSTPGGQSVAAKGYSFQSGSTSGVNSDAAVTCLEEQNANGFDCRNTPRVKSWTLCLESTGSSQNATLTVTPTPGGLTTNINYGACS